MAKHVKSRILLFICGFVGWALLNWVPDWQHLAVGVFVAFFVAMMTGDMFTKRPHHFKDIRRYGWFLYYIPIFLWEVFKANIDVAYRVGHPDIPIHPGIVKVKTRLTSDTGLTFLANSITLTPGTLSVDVDEKNGYLYVHWIEVKHKDVEQATKQIVERFESILGRVFE
jgi:multicomponent Na+:H+ antiporter subunit E